MQTISNTLFLNTGADSLICIPFYKSEMCPSIFIYFIFYFSQDTKLNRNFLCSSYILSASWLEPTAPPGSGPVLEAEEERRGWGCQSSGPRSPVPFFLSAGGLGPYPPLLALSGLQEGEQMESWFWGFSSTPPLPPGWRGN